MSKDEAIGASLSLPLDREQFLAAESAYKRSIVRAGPGSGKTRVLASRFTILAGRGTPLDAILALTFTNKAAAVMAERVRSLVDEFDGNDDISRSLNIKTFHAFALSVLKEFCPPFTLLGRSAELSLLKDIGLDTGRKGLRIFSVARSNFYLLGEEALSPEKRGLVSRYKEAIARAGVLGLDDLVPEAIRLLNSDEEALASLRGRFKEIMVDEYQDIDPLQARLVDILAGPAVPAAPERGLFCIGDPDQTIYGFRGANLDGFLNFASDHPGARTFSLSTNYRSGEKIVKASRAVISNGALLSGARSSTEERGEVTVVEAPDERAEGAFITAEIERRMGGLTSLTVHGAHEDGGEESVGLNFSDFAVLFRTNRQAARLIDAFASSQIPFQLVGPKRLESIDALIERLKGATISDATEAIVDLPLFVKEEAEGLGVEAASIEWLVHIASRFRDMDSTAALSAFIDSLLLSGPEETYDMEADRVTLGTMHMSKGMEFKNVFVSGCSEGLVPLLRGGEPDDIDDCDDGDEIGEERRLFYVAMTRAMDRLYLTRARRVSIFGETREAPPSRFLADIPEALITRKNIEKKRRRRPVQKGLFD